MLSATNTLRRTAGNITNCMPPAHCRLRDWATHGCGRSPAIAPTDELKVGGKALVGYQLDQWSWVGVITRGAQCSMHSAYAHTAHRIHHTKLAIPYSTQCAAETAHITPHSAQKTQSRRAIITLNHHTQSSHAISSQSSPAIITVNHHTQSRNAIITRNHETQSSHAIIPSLAGRVVGNAMSLLNNLMRSFSLFLRNWGLQHVWGLFLVALLFGPQAKRRAKKHLQREFVDQVLIYREGSHLCSSEQKNVSQSENQLCGTAGGTHWLFGLNEAIQLHHIC